jgi:hypothetical protein
MNSTIFPLVAYRALQPVSRNWPIFKPPSVRPRENAKSVIHPELVPLEPAHLMKRQHIDALDVSQTNRKLGHAIHFFHVVRPTRHDNKANSDWMFSRCQEESRVLIKQNVAYALRGLSFSATGAIETNTSSQSSGLRRIS